MTDLEMRVRRGLGSDWNAGLSQWEGLIRLYESDREAFYLLACDGVRDGDDVTRPLSDLAQRVRAAVRSTYSVEQQDGSEDAAIKPRSDEPLPVPRSLLARVKSFLLEIDGKGVGSRPGKDYEGRPVSEAEVRFKLGEPETSDREQTRILARREAKPVALRLTEADFHSLAHQPGYLTYGLFHCARKTVLAPTAVYRGLKRGQGKPASGERVGDLWEAQPRLRKRRSQGVAARRHALHGLRRCGRFRVRLGLGGGRPAPPGPSP